VESFAELIPKIGSAYKWAQNLAGLHFLDLESNISGQSRDFILNFSRLLNLIELRFKSRVLLHKQFDELGKSSLLIRLLNDLLILVSLFSEKGMAILPPNLAATSFSTLICILKDWVHSTLEEWRVMHLTQLMHLSTNLN